MLPCKPIVKIVSMKLIGFYFSLAENVSIPQGYPDSKKQNRKEKYKTTSFQIFSVQLLNLLQGCSSSHILPYLWCHYTESINNNS
jgi:hypothetical protein